MVVPAIAGALGVAIVVAAVLAVLLLRSRSSSRLKGEAAS
jgi:hypothetical protein